MVGHPSSKWVSGRKEEELASSPFNGLTTRAYPITVPSRLMMRTVFALVTCWVDRAEHCFHVALFGGEAKRLTLLDDDLRCSGLGF